jgi:hypothetical protein
MTAGLELIRQPCKKSLAVRLALVASTPDKGISHPSEHGPLLGVAGFDERETMAAIAALQATFRDLERTKDP